MEFQFTPEFYETVKSKRSDSLFDILLPTNSILNQLVLSIGIQVSEIMCVGFHSAQGVDCDMVGISAELLSSMTNNQLAKKVRELLLYYQKWLKNGASVTDNQMLRHHAFSVLWLCDHFSSELDKTTIFKALAYARSQLEKIPSKVSTWGVGLSYHYQSLTILFPIDQTIKRYDLMKGLVLQIQQKSVTMLLSAFDDKFYDALTPLYINQPNYYIASSYGIDGTNQSFSLCLEYFLKAKLANELPSVDFVIGNEALKCLTSYFDFESIWSESNNLTKERLCFYVAMRTIDQNQKEKGNVMEKSMTESAMMREILTKSTLELLTKENNGFSLKEFFAPVKALATTEAEKRLKERMESCQLESKRYIPGDGNCQFSSLSDQLTDEIQHSSVCRRIIVAWLNFHANTELENGAKISEFSYDIPWSHYLQDMSKNGTWGDHLTLIAAAEIFNRPIVVINSLPSDDYLLEINPNIEKRNTSPDSLPQRKILLSHLTEFHYGSVQEKS